ncbi:peptidylprolyl isomerase [Paenibacillus apiarius]|uniref:peptidylprolyl isomerase n=1 Tax=Paenibacillus apiarius TaxID=46240 RepID=UPI0019817085|nr:peptidylprolyl isomerase [Paenibacillus apiarius]MBN3524366.1 peptidylprolyl isomerase [Paenibacillus apiarius]
MTKEVKSLWGCIIILFTCIIILAGILIFRLDTAAEDHGATLPPESSSVVATIGDEQVTRAEWNDELRRQYGAMVLEQILTSKAAEKEANSLGIKVTQEEVEWELKQQMRGYDDDEAYFQAMQEQLGMSPEQLRKDLHNRLLMEKIATNEIEVTEEEVEKYLEQHRDVYEPVASYDIAHIVVPTEWEANDILKRVLQDETFTELAKQLSRDEFTAHQGGRLGWIDEDDPFINKAELNAATQMSVGEISEPIQVKDGYAIVMLNGKKEVEPEERKALRSRVRKDLALSKTPPLTDWEEALRKKYNAAIKDTAFAEQHG